MLVKGVTVELDIVRSIVSITADDDLMTSSECSLMVTVGTNGTVLADVIAVEL